MKMTDIWRSLPAHQRQRVHEVLTDKAVAAAHRIAMLEEAATNQASRPK